MANLFDKVLNHVAENAKLTQLLALMIQSLDDGIVFPEEKLIGDWEFAKPGQRVYVTYKNPYRMETGFLFTLPGVEADSILQAAIIQFPGMSEDDEKQMWILLKHAAILADTIELEPNL
jgi:hypothetical protein